MLQFLLSSRYCEVDRMAQIASDLFGRSRRDGSLRLRFAIGFTTMFSSTTSRLGRPRPRSIVFTERVGVCRDFQHLAITLSRAMNIPARYVTGYLGDIRVPYCGAGDFSAWYEVYLGDRWWALDARHNTARLGRILMATGRDATDVAITTAFGAAHLTHFFVESNEVDDVGEKIPLPISSDTTSAAPEIVTE